MKRDAQHSFENLRSTIPSPMWLTSQADGKSNFIEAEKLGKDSCSVVYERHDAVASLLRISKIPLRYPGRRQVRGWSQTCSELEFALSPAAS